MSTGQQQWRWSAEVEVWAAVRTFMTAGCFHVTADQIGRVSVFFGEDVQHEAVFASTTALETSDLGVFMLFRLLLFLAK
jgi:hypothetical protein